MKTSIRFKVAVVMILLTAFTGKFYAQEPCVIVAATKMNVIYVAIENPVSVSVAGIAADKISVKVNNGIIKGSKGQYVIIPEKVGSCELEVSAEGKLISKQTFQVKRVPIPVPYLNNYSCGSIIPREELLQVEKIEGKMENFDLEFKTEIVSFSMLCIIDGALHEIKSYSAYLTPEMKDLIKRVPSGGKIYFEDIKANLPDGNCTLSPCAITVK